MMFHIASDLHLSHGEQRPAPFPLLGDVLLLAGDVVDAVDASAFRVLRNSIQAYTEACRPVVLVAGNHEYYGRDMEAARAALASLCAEGGIRFLEDAFLDLAVPGSSPPVRIFGATLWTDHCLDGRANLANARSTARKSMNDYASIRLAGRKLTPQTTEAFHRASLEALKHAHATLPPDHAFVVVTHHGPHPASIHPRYAGTNVNPCFASDLSDLIRELRPALWVHGHTHASRDVVVEGCTHLVCNPRGYPLRKSGRYENEAFELDKVVVVGKTWS